MMLGSQLMPTLDEHWMPVLPGNGDCRDFAAIH
jgi:hypothetical protein